MTKHLLIALTAIGDIAIAPSNASVIWVGTGEANQRPSTSYGGGVFGQRDVEDGRCGKDVETDRRRRAAGCRGISVRPEAIAWPRGATWCGFWRMAERTRRRSKSGWIRTA